MLPNITMYRVEYKYSGFLQTIRREFKTKEQAEQWLRQVGKHVEWKIYVGLVKGLVKITKVENFLDWV